MVAHCPGPLIMLLVGEFATDLWTIVLIRVVVPERESASLWRYIDCNGGCHAAGPGTHRIHW